MQSSLVVLGLMSFLSGAPEGYEEPRYEVVQEFEEFEVERPHG